MSGSGYPKFRNDRGVPEISIGVKEFNCIGVSPPHDHPHIYIHMREANTIPCPYCGTRFRFDPRLTPTRRTACLLTRMQPKQIRSAGRAIGSRDVVRERVAFAATSAARGHGCAASPSS
jgi:uncharacterized Zn-finger protein